MLRGTVCVNRARTGLWGVREGNLPFLPGKAGGGMKSGFRVHGLWFREKVRRRKAYEEGRKEAGRVADRPYFLKP